MTSATELYGEQKTRSSWRWVRKRVLRTDVLQGVVGLTACERTVENKTAERSSVWQRCL